MADNLELNAGSGGATLATDDVSSVHFQKIKIDVGADGVSAALSNSNPIPVSDAGGSLTVDNGGTFAVQAAQSGAWNVTNVSGTVSLPTGASTAAKQPALGTAGTASADVITIQGVASMTAVQVADNGGSLTVDNGGTFAVQASSVIPGTGATNLGKAEDAAHTSGDVGVMALFVRQDSQADFGADGDYVPGSIDGDGALRVAIVSGAGSGGTAAADDADFTDGTTQGTPAMGVYESTPTTVTDGDLGVVGITENRELKVSVTSGGVDGKLIDSVAGAADEGIVSLVVRDDALATLTPADGDYTTGRVNARGAQWVCLDSTAAQTVTLAAGTATNEVVGDAAHGAAVAGNPVLVGLEGRSTAPTAVDDGDVVRVLASLLGKQVVLPYAIPANSWSYASPAAVTDTADDEAKGASGAGIRNYVTGVQVFNGHDTTGTEVVIKDGSTVIWRGWAEQTGGGCSAKFDPPLRGTANTAVNVANITNSSSTYFNLQGYSAAE